MKTFKHKNNGSTMTFSDGCMKIENLVIEGTPNLDYWEEVVEKEWEILSFKNESNNQIYINRGHIWDSGSDIGARSYEYCLKYYSIFSAKNLKTGEVVTIGNEYEEGVVDNFSPTVFGGKLLVEFKSFYFYIACNILDLTPLKKPLFTTYDGVDIYEYTDRVFTWVTDGDIVMCEVNEQHVKSCLSKPETYKVFSTRESAEEYILMNKPLLSVNDIIDILDKSNAEQFRGSIPFKTLINFVKAKV